MKAIFTSQPEPSYRDIRERRYHFPGRYLKSAEAAVGDQALYYEPRRVSSGSSNIGGRQAYFAVVHVDRIEKDPLEDDRYFAYVSGYLDFDNAVPFREGATYFEQKLQRADGGTNKGAFGRSVRIISDNDFQSILAAGFVERPDFLAGTGSELHGFAEAQRPFERPIIETTISRPFRDRAFTRQIQNAYEQTCAFTGLKIINGGGRPEVQAAHIWPVADHGPDSVRNGLALSGTIHWMFDRGLVSLTDDFRILTAGDKVPDQVSGLFRPNQHALVPDASQLRPHPEFLRYHRERIFKG